MSLKKRKTQRFKAEGDVVLVLCEGEKSIEIAGPSVGSLSDVSITGAAIIVNQINFGDYNLGSSPLENSSLFLRMRGDDFLISSRPVWYHYIQLKKEPHYRIGLEFIDQPDKAQFAAMLSHETKTKKGFWNQTLEKLFPTIK